MAVRQALLPDAASATGQAGVPVLLACDHTCDAPDWLTGYGDDHGPEARYIVLGRAG